MLPLFQLVCLSEAACSAATAAVDEASEWREPPNCRASNVLQRTFADTLW